MGVRGLHCQRIPTVTQSNCYEYTNRPIGQRGECVLRQWEVVLQLRANGDEHPGVARFVQVTRRVRGGLPNAERTHVVMARRKESEREVEDLVGRVEHQIGSCQQACVARKQRDGTRADVLLDRPRRVRSDEEGAVHHGPWALRRGVLQYLDAEERGDDRVRSHPSSRPYDWDGRFRSPRREALFNDDAGSGEIASGGRHRLANRACQPRPQVELMRQHLHGQLLAGQGSPNCLVGKERDFVASPAQLQSGGGKRLEIAAGSAGRNHEVPLAVVCGSQHARQKLGLLQPCLASTGMVAIGGPADVQFHRTTVASSLAPDQPHGQPPPAQALRNRVALVTGASSGIGAGLAAMLAAEGARVVLAARSADRLEAVTTRIRDAGGVAMPIVTDVSNDGSLGALIDQCRAEFDGVDVLVNNAGYAVWKPLEATTIDEWDRTFAVNLRAAAILCAQLLPAMQARGFGRIINISSEAGVAVVPGLAAYSVSKHALVALTEVIQNGNHENGIKGWAVCPGFVETNMGDVVPGANPEHFLKVQEVVDIVRFLLRLGDNVKLGSEILVRTMRNPNQGSG